MANQPFNRTIINPLEKPLSSDINQDSSQADRGLREVLFRLLAARTSTTNSASKPGVGFIGESARVVAAGGMVVTLKAGLGFQDNAADVPAAIGGVIGLDDLHRYKPVVIGSDVTLAVPAAPGANSRVDIIEVKYLRQTDNAQSRQVLDPVGGTFSPSMLAKTVDFNVEGSVGTVVDPATSVTAIGYKQGQVGSPGVAPAVTAGYVKVAEIFVAAGTVAIASNLITDRRALIPPGGVLRAGIRFRLQWNAGAPIVTVLDGTLPPGLEFALVPSTIERGSFALYVWGGEIANATYMIFTQTPAGALAAGQTVQAPSSTAFACPIAADVTRQGIIAAATTASSTAIAVGQKLVIVNVDELCYRDATGAGTDNNAILQDVTHTVHVDMSY